MPKLKEKVDDRIFINPRIDSAAKLEFERNMFEQKQKGVHLNMSKLFRAFVEKFNQDPDGELKRLGLKK